MKRPRATAVAGDHSSSDTQPYLDDKPLAKRKPGAAAPLPRKIYKARRSRALQAIHRVMLISSYQQRVDLVQVVLNFHAKCTTEEAIEKENIGIASVAVVADRQTSGGTVDLPVESVVDAAYSELWAEQSLILFQKTMSKKDEARFIVKSVEGRRLDAIVRQIIYSVVAVYHRLLTQGIHFTAACPLADAGTASNPNYCCDTAADTDRTTRCVWLRWNSTAERVCNNHGGQYMRMYSYNHLFERSCLGNQTEAIAVRTFIKYANLHEVSLTGTKELLFLEKVRGCMAGAIIELASSGQAAAVMNYDICVV